MTMKAKETDPIGNEPVLQNGKVIGRLTSASFGHSIGKAIALSYLPADIAKSASRIEIEVLSEMRPAQILSKAPYDASGSCSHMRM